MLTPKPPTPLPAALTRRLQAIPRLVVVCRDVDRLYAEARRRAAPKSTTPDPTPDPPAAEHLASCAHCRQLYGVLESALREPRQPLPQHLVPRLAALADRPSWTPPRWLRDARYAAAACLLLAASLTFVVEDAAAGLKEARGSMAATTAALTETMRTRTEEVRPLSHWEGLATGLEEFYSENRHRASRLESSWREFNNNTLREFEAIGRRLSQPFQSPPEGEPHGS